jgi:hypothetical protein
LIESPVRNLDSSKISFQSEQTSPFLGYFLKLVGSTFGYRFETREPDDLRPVDIFYGESNDRPSAIHIPYVRGYTADTVPLPSHSLSANETPERTSLAFDVVSAVRFWLADEGNRDLPAEAFDIHGRLIAERSVQQMLGVVEVPSVNFYLLQLRCLIERRLGIVAFPHLPQGRHCTIVLSHDVDDPISPGDPRHHLWLAGRGARRRQPKSVARHVRGAARSVINLAREPRARHWLFDRIASAEERHGYRSTFFFATTSRFMSTGLPQDVGYVVSAPRFRSVFRDLSARGFGIGLHISYGVLDSAARLRAEKSRLESLFQQPILGSRHHFWHMTRPFWPSLQAHADAGLVYDSSVAFNESPGFRLGVGLPFKPWNPLTQREVGTLQLPVVIMDGAFFYERGATVESTLERFGRILDVLKQYEAVAAIDWHEYTSFPSTSRAFRPWGDAYLAILDVLASDSEVAVETYPEIVARWNARVRSVE